MKNYLKILLLPLLFIAIQTTSQAQSIGCDSCTTQAKGNTKIHKAIALDTLTPTQAFKIYYGKDTAAMIFRNPVNDSIYFMWRGVIYNPASGGGGGGGDVQPAAQIVYGTGTGVTSNPNFVYDPTSTLGLFDVQDAGGNQMIVAGESTGQYGIGDIGGFANGTALNIFDQDSRVTIFGNKSPGPTFGEMLHLDGQVHDYIIGDVDQISSGAQINLLELTSTTWQANIYDKAGLYLSINQYANMYQIGDISGINHNTFMSIDDVGQIVSMSSVFGMTSAVFFAGGVISGTDIAVELGDVNSVGNLTVMSLDDQTKSTSITNAIAFPSMPIQVPASGSTVVIQDGTRGAYIDPATTLATLTIRMNPNPIDGEELFVFFGGTITTGAVVTALTVAPNSGQTVINAPAVSTVLMAGQVIVAKYRQSGSFWYIF